MVKIYNKIIAPTITLTFNSLGKVGIVTRLIKTREVNDRGRGLILDPWSMDCQSESDCDFNNLIWSFVAFLLKSHESLLE